MTPSVTRHAARINANANDIKYLNTNGNDPLQESVTCHAVSRNRVTHQPALVGNVLAGMGFSSEPSEPEVPPIKSRRRRKNHPWDVPLAEKEAEAIRRAVLGRSVVPFERITIQQLIVLFPELPASLNTPEVHAALNAWLCARQKANGHDAIQTHHLTTIVGQMQVAAEKYGVAKVVADLRLSARASSPAINVLFDSSPRRRHENSPRLTPRQPVIVTEEMRQIADSAGKKLRAGGSISQAELNALNAVKATES